MNWALFTLNQDRYLFCISSGVKLEAAVNPVLNRKAFIPLEFLFQQLHLLDAPNQEEAIVVPEGVERYQEPIPLDVMQMVREYNPFRHHPPPG